MEKVAVAGKGLDRGASREGDRGRHRGVKRRGQRRDEEKRGEERRVFCDSGIGFWGSVVLWFCDSGVLGFCGSLVLWFCGSLVRGSSALGSMVLGF